MRTGTPGFRPSRLRLAREARGLTQVGLAELVGRSSQSVSRWENDEHEQSLRIAPAERATGEGLSASIHLRENAHRGGNKGEKERDLCDHKKHCAKKKCAELPRDVRMQEPRQDPVQGCKEANRYENNRPGSRRADESEGQ